MATTTPPASDKRQVQNLCALSPMQEGILFHALYEERSAVYFEQATIEVEGVLDVTCFEQAWNALLQRHEALRTNFVVKNVPQPLQVIWQRRNIDFSFRDLSALDERAQADAVAAFQREDLTKGFDLSRDVLIRIGLLKKRHDRFLMVMSFHHIIMDGWCQGIIQRELVELYSSLRERRPPRLPSRVPPFRDYIKWLERQDKQGALDFWAKRLSGYERRVSLSRLEPQAGATLDHAPSEHVTFQLSAEKTAALTALAAEAGVTVSTLVQAAWGTLLCAENGVRDAVFAAIVSGRPPEIDGVENIVGLFINAIATRITVRAGEPWVDFVTRIRAETGETLPYQHCPLADVQARTSLKRSLLDHILVFENYPEEEQGSGEAPPFRLRQIDVVEQTNYDLTVQVYPGVRLGFGLAYSSAAIRRSDVEAVEPRLNLIFDALLSNRAAPVDEILDKLIADGASGRAVAPDATGPSLRVAVAATFTADPVAPFIAWWGRQAGIDTEVELAPYNQVFQQLLDPGSLLSREDQARVILSRCEDWTRDAHDLSTQERLEHLSSTFDQLLQALAAQPEGRLTLLGVLPVSGRYARSAEEIDLLHELNRRLAQFAASARGVRLLDCGPVAELYGIEEVFDDSKDRSGHVPFSDAYIAALGTTIARALRSACQPAFKVIAVDCDNTLWKGVCGEDGPLGVTVEAGHLDLQRFLIERAAEGFLIALCSKNNEADVWEVFAQNPGMALRKEHIVASRINWQPKSKNIEELSAELGLGLDSFIFVDDSGVECAEVMQNRPEVLTLRLPGDATGWPSLLRHTWAFDVWRVTEEDRKRTQMYLAEGQREQSRKAAASLEDYLASLNLRVTLSRAGAHQIERLAQLTQRTNQFNLSTIRRTEQEVAALLDDKETLCWSVNVRDRFGDYGLVGFVVARVRRPALFIDTLLLSCRVLGRGVEDVILAALRGVCEEQGIETVEALYVRTKKNAPIREFIERSGWRSASDDGERTLYVLAASELRPAPAHAQVAIEARSAPPEEVRPPATLGAAPEAPDRAAFEAIKAAAPLGEGGVPAAPPAVPQARGAGSAGGTSGSDWRSAPEVQWLVEAARANQLVHGFHYLPLQHATGEQLLRLAIEPESAQVARGDDAPPRDALEIKVAALWKDVLRCSEVGVHSSFFELGGHSLKAVQLLSRIHRELGVELTLKHIMEHPTVAGLARAIRHASANAVAPIERVPTEPHYRLSNAQRRMWALEQLQGETSAYTMAGALEIVGDLDVEALEAAFQRVIARHESLRTILPLIEGEPRQVVLPELSFHLERHDLRAEASSVEDRLLRARALAEQEISARFDLANGPLVRASLLTVDAGRSVFVLCMHHIIGDGWSYGVLLREVAEIYSALRRAAAPELSPLPIQYKDYAAWQSAFLSSDQAAPHRKYWHEALQGELPVLDLPTDRPRPPVPAFRGGAVSLKLDAALSAGLRGLCRRYNVTLFMALLAAVDALLARYTGQRDIIVGTPAAGREHPDLEHQIGLYVNTLALRTAVDGDAPFSTLLGRVKQVVLEGFERQSYPFDVLVEELNLRRDPSRSPLFDVMLVVQDGDSASVSLEGVTARDFLPESGAGKFDLVFNVLPLASSIDVQVEYRADLFDAPRMQRLAAHFEALLGSIVSDAERPIQELELLTSAEQAALLAPQGADAADERLSATLPALFERRAAEAPHADAVVCGDERITYAQLEDRAAVISTFLNGQLGAAPRAVVGVLLPRSVAAVVAQVGILKAGCVYLPLDPDYPEERLRHILQHSRCTLLLTNEALSDRFRGPGCPRLVDVASLATIAPSAEPPSATPAAPPLADDTACLIYTSGSTGTPKGVACHHRGLINTALEQIDFFRISRESRVLQFASPAFDAALSEVWTALLSGATLVIVGRGIIEDTHAFTAYLEAHDVTVATLPPVYLRALERHPLPTLRTLVTAGEAPDTDLARFYASRLRYINAYGPAECSICATMYVVDPALDYATGIPVGAPLKNTQCIVVDSALTALPLGVVGELCIVGIGLTHGYAYQAELTAERFITHPRYGRLYRTGDLARQRDDGGIEFLGRQDEQIKIRGQRVEPEEVRRRLLAHEAVDAAAVIDRDGPHGGKELAAFVSLRAPATVAALRRWLSTALTAAMVPSVISIVDRIPKTPNGKVDKAALRGLAVRQEDPGEGEQRPLTEAERELADAFAEVLGLPRIGPDDSYFALGGDSIKAIRIVAVLRRRGIGLEVREIFAHPTIAELAPRIRREIPGPAIARAAGAALAGEHPSSQILHRGGGTTRLYCLPFAGSDAGVFPVLLSGLDPSIEVHAVDLPGRGAMRGQPPLTTIAAMAAAVIERIRRDGDGPYALYGHSMGALVAYEVARRAAAGSVGAPIHVFCSGLPAPWRIARRARMTDEELLEALSPAQLDQGVEAAKAMLRADDEAVRLYRHESSERLDVEMTVMVGSEEEIPEADLLAWNEATAGAVVARRFAGGHMFIFDHGPELSALISGALVGGGHEAESGATQVGA